MATPVDGNARSWFQPLGDTPACSFAQGLPADGDVTILSLGCGDIRNPLFTSHLEPNRKISITCVDHNADVIARNILMLSLIVDGKHNWEIYYHAKISTHSLKVILQRAEELCSIDDLDGKVQTLDPDTFRKVREIWESYKSKRNSEANLGRISLGRKEQIEQNRNVVSGIRASAPYLHVAVADLPGLNDSFWRDGTVDGNLSAGHTNPLFISSSPLWHATNPLPGFHLSLGYASTQDGVRGPVSAAKEEFDCWAQSFRESRTFVKYCWADALSFCYASQSCRAFRTSYTVKPLVLDEQKFDMIDTSNLADDLSTLNVMVAASPLLKPSGLLRTEITWIGDRPTELLADLLEGDFQLTSSLLGLTLLEYGTNASTTSTTDLLFLHTVSKARRPPHGTSGVILRFSWKAVPSIKLDAEELCSVLLQIYQAMFHRDSPRRTLDKVKGDKSLLLEYIKQFPHFHRGSFARFLRGIHTCSTDWSATIRKLLESISSDEDIKLTKQYIQELYLWLHLLGLYTLPVISYPAVVDVFTGHALDFWSSLPGVVWLTVRIPRLSLQPIATLDNELRSMAIHGIVGSASVGTVSLYASVQMFFGEMRQTGSGRDLRIQLIEDARGIDSDAQVFVSFQVLSWRLIMERERTIVGLGAQAMPLIDPSPLATVGSDLSLFKTNLGDSSNVFVTVNPPNSSYMNPMVYPKLQPHSGTVVGGQISENKLDSVIARLNITSQGQKLALLAGAKVVLHQFTPWEYELIFKEFKHSISLPIPSTISRCKVRVERKSAVLELEAWPLSDKERSRMSPFPVMLTSEGIKLLNVSRANLDALPIVNLEGNLKWFDTHISYTSSIFKHDDRKLDTTTTTGNTRAEFKNSLSSLYTHFSRIKNNAGPFRIFQIIGKTSRHTAALILVNNMRLDFSGATFMLDVAILPMLRTLDADVASVLRKVKLEKQIFGYREVDESQVRMWKQVIPAFIERCRTWSHTDTCRYRKVGRVPLSLVPGEQFYCTCGNGIFPKDYLADIPEFANLKRHCTRAAISLCFSIPYVEDITPPWVVERARKAFEACLTCQEPAWSTKLMKCGQCHEAQYCSRQCQKKDWPKHKQECKKR